MNKVHKNCPKISIVTPSFNQAIYLEDTILSVLGQNYPNLEYIIIDGGSTDGSVEIIEKYKNALTYWISEPDKGMYYAIQKGFNKSTGEIMAWINSDDMYHKNALFTVAEIFSSLEQVSWLAGATTAFDEAGRTVYVNQSRRFTKFDFYNGDYKWLQQESVFWRRSIWEKAGAMLNLSLKYAGDFELWTKFFSFEKLYVTHALIGGFRWRSSNQISVDHLDDYLNEVESVLSSLELSKSDLKILINYKRLLALEQIIMKLRIFRTDWMIKRFRRKHFLSGNYILSDRLTGAFILAD